MSHPRGFLPEPARHGFAVALGPLPAALVPSLASLLACLELAWGASQRCVELLFCVAFWYG